MVSVVSFHTVGFFPYQGAVNCWIKFFEFLAIVILMAFAGQSLGFLLGSLVMKLPAAQMLMACIGIPLIQFNPVISINIEPPSYVSWIQWISPYYYAGHALLVWQYDGLVVQDLAPAKSSIAENYRVQYHAYLVEPSMCSESSDVDPRPNWHRCGVNIDGKHYLKNIYQVYLISEQTHCSS